MPVSADAVTAPEPSSAVIALTGTPCAITVRRPLSPAAMALRALPLALLRARGGVPGEVRPIVVRQRGVSLEPARIEAFRRVCAFTGQAGGVPPTFPEIYFTALMAEAVLSPPFPLSPLGLIHVRQEVSQLVPLRPGAILDATAELGAMRRTDKGIEIDFGMRLEARGEAVWTGLATLLSRARTTRAHDRHVHAPPAAPEGQVIAVPAATGLAFARVSGDYNPHHLWRWTARPLGYHRPIAHGMWTFARALSPLLDEVDADERVTARVELKRPLFLPGRACIVGDPLSAARRESRFEVCDAETRLPHLVGRVSSARSADRSSPGT